LKEDSSSPKRYSIVSNRPSKLYSVKSFNKLIAILR